MHFLATAFLVAASIALNVAVDDSEDTSYGGAEGFMQDQILSGSSDFSHERQDLPIDPRGGHLVENVGSSSYPKFEHLEYNKNEWKFVEEGLPISGTFLTHGAPRKFLLQATPKIPSNKVKISIAAWNSTRTKLHFKFNIKRAERSGDILPPVLQIFKVVNGNSMLDMIEKETDGWVDETLKFYSGVNQKVVFVAQLNSALNEIAIGDIELEDLDHPSIHEGFLKEVPVKASAEKKGAVEASSSYASIGNEYAMEEAEEASAVQTESEADAATTVQPTDIALTTPSLAEVDSGPHLDASPETEDTAIAVQDSDQHPSLDEETGTVFNSSEGNVTQSDLGGAEATSGNSLKIFLIIAVLCGIATFAFIMWRRHRQRRHDDEIPVFSRSQEQNNPSFSAEVEGEIDPSSRSNYRSFQ